MMKKIRALILAFVIAKIECGEQLLEFFGKYAERLDDECNSDKVKEFLKSVGSYFVIQINEETFPYFGTLKMLQDGKSPCNVQGLVFTPIADSEKASQETSFYDMDGKNLVCTLLLNNQKLQGPWLYGELALNRCNIVMNHIAVTDMPVFFKCAKQDLLPILGKFKELHDARKSGLSSSEEIRDWNVQLSESQEKLTALLDVDKIRHFTTYYNDDLRTATLQCGIISALETTAISYLSNGRRSIREHATIALFTHARNINKEKSFCVGINTFESVTFTFYPLNKENIQNL